MPVLGLPTSWVLLKTGEWKLSTLNPLKHVHGFIFTNPTRNNTTTSQHDNITFMDGTDGFTVEM